MVIKHLYFYKIKLDKSIPLFTPLNQTLFVQFQAANERMTSPLVEKIKYGGIFINKLWTHYINKSHINSTKSKTVRY